MKKLISITILFIILANLSLWAQDARADLIKINEYYQGKALSTEMRLLIFPSHESQSVADEFAANYIKTADGTHYYYKFGENEMVQTTDFSLLVDHANKMMMIQPAVTPPVPDLSVTIDSLLKKSGSVTYSLEGEKARYSFSFEKGPYPRIDLVFDRSTLLIDRLIHFYHKGAYHGVKGITQEDAVRSELVYDNTRFDLPPNSAEEYFTEKRFMNLKDGGYAALTAFSEYRLFDFINLN
jgi:hypothetical protein